MLVPMLIRHRLSSEFVRGKMMVHVGVGVATQTILDAECNPRIRQHMLNAGARHHARW